MLPVDFGGFRKLVRDLQMSSKDLAIVVENLSKGYQIYNLPQDRLKQSIIPRLQWMFGRPPKTYYHEFWALRNVSFEIQKGETVGIIGRNGSGKSTLLQLICGTLTPTEGIVKTNGRIAALLELGSGFNPEFTGRENVYLNGAILGLSKQEIDLYFDDIAGFADIGEFIEQPVKMYSSGMYVRLAFAINVMSRPDIMVVDEALAVGDMKLQSKCITALKRRQEEGTTVLFVSHDVGTVKSLCSRGIYLEHGEVKSIGTAASVAEQYVRVVREEMNEDQFRPDHAVVAGRVNTETGDSTKQTTAASDFKSSDLFDQKMQAFRYGSGEARITYVELLDENDQPLTSVEFNQEVQIKIYFISYHDLALSPNYYILDDKKNLILGGSPGLFGESLVHAGENSRYVITYKTALPLQEGNYSIQFQLTSIIVADETANFHDVIEDAIVFNVERRKHVRIWTKVYLPNTYDCLKV